MDQQLIFGLISFLLGGYIIVQAIMSISKGIDSEEWPRVQGEILETGIQSSLGSKGGTMYAPMIRYRFEYMGTAYVCDNIKVGGTISTNIRSFARKSVERYHSKQIVNVSVCADDPTLSVLEPGISSASYFALAIGAIFFALGVKYLLSHFGVEISI